MSQKDRAIQLIREGNNKVEAIKILRDEYGIGLPEAKKLVDSAIDPSDVSSIKNPISISSKLTYRGGHPKLTKEKDCSIIVSGHDITIKCGILSSAAIPFSNITGLHLETIDETERRITATRLVTMGVFALAFKKKKTNTEKNLIIDFVDNNIQNCVLITGKNVPLAHSKIYNQYSAYTKAQNIAPRETIEEVPALDPYEELKKLKELLDLGIVTEEEFITKKKQLLGL